jgi:hypothetical protein
MQDTDNSGKSWTSGGTQNGVEEHAVTDGIHVVENTCQYLKQITCVYV